MKVIFLGITNNFKKKFLSKQKSMKINFEKKENIGAHKEHKEGLDAVKEEIFWSRGDRKISSKKLEWKSKEEIKDEFDTENSSKQNDQQQWDDDFQEDEEGPVVRCYSEGALKKFRTLPNRS